MIREPPPRFGLRNLLALAGLAGWSWWIASLDLDLGLPGVDLASLARELPVQAAWFVPVGLLIPLALPRMRSLLGRFLLILLPSLAIGAVLATAIVAAPPDAPESVLQGFTVPGPFTLFVPLVGMAVGVLLGSLLAGSLGTALLLIPALLALAAILLAMAAVILLLLTDRIPIAEPIGEAGVIESRMLLADLRDGKPLDSEQIAGGVRLLAEAGMDPSFRLRLDPVGEGVRARISLPWDLPLLGVRYLNAEALAAPSVEGGAFRAGVRTLSVGGWRLPSRVVRAASRAGSRWASRFLPYGPAHRVRGGHSDGHAVRNRRLVQVLEGLRERAAEIHSRPDRLAGAVTAAFALSREHSGLADPVEENRVALLALGGSAGHPSLLTLAGFPDTAEFAGALGRELEVTVFRRNDWARHFLGSAGLTQVGPVGMTEQAGALKERLDATRGSGFSFSDLMMDSAGARFGRKATRDPAAARAMQARIAAGIMDADLVPDVAGLPEGISQARLEAEFGGFSGEAFREMEAEIERRLSQLTLYQ